MSHRELHSGGWPRYWMLTPTQRGLQRLREAWWILRGKHSLHRAWQVGHDQGVNHEYRRLITNRAYLGEINGRLAGLDTMKIGTG